MASSVIAGDDNWHVTIDEVIVASAEKVWTIASDWLGFPRSCTVDCTEGHNGVPGCVRRVQAHDSNFWVAEKLTHVDHDSRFLTYDLIGGNSGIAVGYKSAFQVSLTIAIAIPQVIAEGESRTRVIWPFMFSPEQDNVDAFTAIIEKKVKVRIKELEALAQVS